MKRLENEYTNDPQHTKALESLQLLADKLDKIDRDTGEFGLDWAGAIGILQSSLEILAEYRQKEKERIEKLCQKQ